MAETEELMEVDEAKAAVPSSSKPEKPSAKPEQASPKCHELPW